MALNTQARIGGSGALLKMSAVITGSTVDTSTSNYTTVAEVNNINPSFECGEVDVTSLNSGTVRQFIPGHLAATIQLNANLVQAKTSATNHDVVDMLDVYQGREQRGWLIAIPLGNDTTTTTDETFNWIAPGFITNFSPSITNGDEPMTVDLTIRVADSTITDTVA